ncbi:MAG: FAD-dependent oxidoreductase [Actinomycetes bacterium]
MAVETDFDFLIIGSGPAGEKAGALAAYHGRRVAIVERAARPGGTMVDGASGTKTMREAALYLTGYRRREVYGVGLDLEPQLAVDGVRARADDVHRLLTDQVDQNLARHGITLVPGTGRLAGRGLVAVEPPGGGPTRTLTAPVVLLATGSRPHHPAAIPFDDPDVFDSDTAGALTRPVRTLAIVGGGAVACEYASIFAALGTAVTLVESGERLLRFMDAEISGLLAEAFRGVGMRVLLGASHARVRRDGEGIVVALDSGELIRPEKVIVAAGRVGNSDGLGLAEAGVETDERGHVRVDDRFATTAVGIFAAGDVTGPPTLASVAMEQGRVAACHAFGIPLRHNLDSCTPYGVYAIPEVAMVGMTEEAARAAGEDYGVGRARLARNARSASRGSSIGLVKLVFRRRDRRLLGAHIVGDDATELIHLAQALIYFDAGIDYLVHRTFNVPTAHEAYKYAAYDGLSRVENRPTLTANA